MWNCGLDRFGRLWRWVTHFIMLQHVWPHRLPCAGPCTWTWTRFVGPSLKLNETFSNFSLVLLSKRLVSTFYVNIQIAHGFHWGSLVPGEYPFRQWIWIWNSKAWKWIRSLFLSGLTEKHVSRFLLRLCTILPLLKSVCFIRCKHFFGRILSSIRDSRCLVWLESSEENHLLDLDS